MRCYGRYLIASVMLALGGCNLPAAAPTVSQVETRHDPDWEFYLVNVTRPILRALEQNPGSSFPASFHLGGYTPSIALRPGDTVGVTIFESGGPSLFGSAVQATPTLSAAPDQSSNSSRTTTLPSQVIESNGKILVPFAGSVHVAGKTPADAARDVEKLLAGQTVNPQALITVLSNNTNSTSVGGDVNRAGMVALSLRGERLLDVIAMAGGPKYAAIDTDVRVQRGNQVATVSLQKINLEPQENIPVRPKDSIVLIRNPKTFTVMGAAQKVSQFSFDTEKVTVAEALARAGGSADTIGNIAGVYVFRYEPADKARMILSADHDAVVAAAPPPSSADRFTPIMYKMNLSEPEGYFAAQAMLIRNRDLILVTNAEGTQLLKAFALARGATGMFYDVSRAATRY